MKNDLQSYLKENALHGTQEFPVGFYAVRPPLNSQDMLIHWHEEMEFTKVCSGALRYSIDQTHCELNAGDIILISPDTLHSSHPLPGQTSETNSLVFHLRLTGLDNPDACTQRYVQPIRDGTLRIPPVIHPGEPFYEEISGCFDEMWACQDPELPYRELRFKMKALELIQLVWQFSAGKVTAPPGKTFRLYENKLKIALAYIQEHYPESITVKQLADLCGFSQVHFMNIFKLAIGCTCIEYLVEYRLARAALDLQETDHSIMQIALDNGFQNMSYFNRSFKKQYSETPSAYRRRMK